MGRPTPHPWVVTRSKTGYPVGIRSATKRTGSICLLPSLHEDIEANAVLLAAAPELLEALKAVVSLYRTFRDVPKREQEWTTLDDETMERALAVIARAEGVSTGGNHEGN